jgi:toxin ParE1/3/4
MKLELSRRAQADLDDIRDFSLERFGTVRAVAYLDAVEQAFRRILGFPEIGAPHPKVTPPLRSLACEQHRIFYEVRMDRVVVQRVLHKAMDVDRHL